MIPHPFPLLRQFSSVLDIRLLTKEDNVSSDIEITKATGVKKVSSLHQVHGNKTLRVSEATSRSLKADAHATDKSRLSLVLRTADCQSFIFFDPKKNVFALAHAGWRGVRAKVLTSTVELLKREWKCDPADLYVGAGPSLCMQCAEFTDPKTEAPELSAFTKDRHIDLQAAADAELVSLGIPASHIDRSPDCTRCTPTKYWTYRGGDRAKVMEGYENVLVARLL